MTDELQIRVHGDALLPTLVYLPGMHGDWTLVSSFRAAMAGRVRFVEFAYPRTLTWSLDDYARAIEQALLANGIERGWLLGESFGSQPAWAIIARDQISGEPIPSRENCRSVPEVRLPSSDGGGGGSNVRKPPRSQPHFQTQGLILAGGFVRHPVNWAVRMAGLVSSAIPLWFVKLFCVVYACYARFRHQRAPETLARIGEFFANRTVEADRRAMGHPLTIITGNELPAH